MSAEDGDGEPPEGPESGPHAFPAATPETSPAAIARGGRRAGKSYRQIAVDLYGADRVDAEWCADSWMWDRVRRLLRLSAAKRGPGGG